MKIAFFILTFIICGNLFGIPYVYGQKKETEVTFCQFPLNEHTKEGNASFTLRYKIKIGDDGKPNQVFDLTDLPVVYVNKEQAEMCIFNWRFPDLPNDSSLVVFFRWEHGKGWTELSITGKNFKQIIKLSGERCPYSNNPKNGSK